MLNGRSYSGTSDADILRGGLGNDQYSVDSADDTVDEETEGGGIDTVVAHVTYTLAAGVEKLVLVGDVDGTGNDLANNIRGSNEGNTLNGGAGKDKLIGGLGGDVMTGGAGRDTFDYDRIGHSAGGLELDQITDFVRGEDRIDLSTMDADPLTDGNQAFSFVGAAPGVPGAGQVRYFEFGGTTIVEANGGGILQIRLDGVLALTAADFVL